MTHMSHTHALMQLTASPRLPLVAVLAVRFAGIVTTWDHNLRTRYQLKHLDHHMLNDIGLTEAQAHKESERPFWQI